MKKTLIVVAVIALAAFVAVSCGSAPVAQQRVALEPDFVQNIQRNPPEDAFVGIGTARAGTEHMARTMAENRARVSIAQQMNSTVRNMITDYTAASEIDGAMMAFFESVSQTLAEARLVGTRPQTQTFRGEGTFEVWTVMTMSKSDAFPVIENASAAAAALAPHANAALWSLERMDRAFADRDGASVIRD